MTLQPLNPVPRIYLAYLEGQLVGIHHSAQRLAIDLSDMAPGGRYYQTAMLTRKQALFYLARGFTVIYRTNDVEYTIQSVAQGWHPAGLRLNRISLNHQPKANGK